MVLGVSFLPPSFVLHLFNDIIEPGLLDNPTGRRGEGGIKLPADPVAHPDVRCSCKVTRVRPDVSEQWKMDSCFTSLKSLLQSKSILTFTK